MVNTPKQKRIRRHIRVRAKIKGTAGRPRLSVFKSNLHFYVQLIDDEAGKTLVSASDKELKLRKKTRKAVAYEVGKTLAKKSSERGVKKVVFDRGGHKFHGIIAEIAKGVKEGGLEF